MRVVTLRQGVMVEITRSPGSYAVVASTSMRANAETLARVAQAAGNSAPSPTETNLRTQYSQLSAFINNVSFEAEAQANLEITRGLSKSLDISAVVADALVGVQQRMGGTESLIRSQNAKNPAMATRNAALAMLSSFSSDEEGFDFSALVTPKSRKIVPNAITASTTRPATGDPFDRSIPMSAITGGMATLNIQRTALRAAPVNISLDKGQPALGSISAAGYEPDGPVLPDNDAFMITANGGDANDTLIIDTRDPTSEDTRVSAVTVNAGAGSDVIFVAGNNVSRIDGGDGDDLIAAEGDAVVDGGEGNDMIFARNATGDAGDDVIFTDGFASGGEGDDQITVFSLDRTGNGDGIRKLAFGGSGNDQIVASVSADIDGGEGDDALVLRNGGSASGGSGDDRISAWSTATIEGGDGNDDMMLLFGGKADGGAGNDTISIGTYGYASGGKGSDTVTFNRGGTYTYTKGDGSDVVNLRKALSNFDDNILEPRNKIILEDIGAGDMTLDLQATSLTLTSSTPTASNDRIEVNRELLGEIDIIFRKNGMEQVLKINGLTQTLGAPTPIIR